MELARQMGIGDYPTPAGGCKLTDPGFSNRLRDLFEHSEDPSVREVELLRLGRHFRLSPEVKVVVGRNQTENEQLVALARPRDVHLIVDGPPGPDVLVISSREVDGDAIELAARITAGYSDAPADRPATVRVTTEGHTRELTVLPLPRDEVREMLI
jgi:predicted ribosome quality control (RQC) complex YloA/Tae2 family protein